MNNEKQRLLLIVLFMFGWVFLLQSLGLLPNQQKKAADKAKAVVNKPEGARTSRQGRGAGQGGHEAGRGAGQGDQGRER